MYVFEAYPNNPTQIKFQYKVFGILEKWIYATSIGNWNAFCYFLFFFALFVLLFHRVYAMPP